MKLKTFCKLKDGERGQVICFPYLGGYVSSFQELVHAAKEEDVEIWVANPPGHFGSELPLVSNIDELLSIYHEDISKIIKPDSLFFGHSMGGIIAFSLLEKMISAHDSILPVTLMMSASAAPCCFANRGYGKMSRQVLFDTLKSYGAMPEVILNNRELMKNMLPIFQADYNVLESCATKAYQKIDINAYLLWGMEDKVEDINNIHFWEMYFLSDLKVIPVYNAEHMYIHDRADEIASYINQAMDLQLLIN